MYLYMSEKFEVVAYNKLRVKSLIPSSNLYYFKYILLCLEVEISSIFGSLATSLEVDRRDDVVVMTHFIL